MKGGNILSLSLRNGHGIMPNGIAHLFEEEYGFENESKRVKCHYMITCLMRIILPYIQ